MKKNKMMRIASVLLVAVLLSTCAISGTFAKYTTSQSEKASARVARWDIDFAANDTTKNFKFDLFDTIKDNDGTSIETDVKNNKGDGKKVIAPGTSGSFTISLKNLSEVTAQYAIEYTVTADGIPVQFSTDNKATWKSTIDAVTASDSTKLEMNAAATNITIYWKWPFTAEDPNTDEKDTNLGKADAATITVVATVTVTQVD